jgi:hypothetical protein
MLGQAMLEFPFEEYNFKRGALNLLVMLASRRFISLVKILGVFISK